MRARDAAARAASLRHALEPAAAALELRVQPVAHHHAACSSAIERFMIRRSRVVIVICPSLEETVAGDRSARADRADRERARARPRTKRRPSRPRRSRAIAGPGAADADRALHRARSRRIRGSTCCSRRWRSCDAARPDARLVLAGGKPDQVARAREQARAAGIDDVTLFAGERPASEIPAYLLAATCWCRRDRAARTRR